MIAADLDVRHFTHEDLPQIRQTLIDLHAAAQGADRDDEFKKKSPWFVDHWGGNPDFACVIAYDGVEPVGFAYGAPATPERVVTRAPRPCPGQEPDVLVLRAGHHTKVARPRPGPH
uniref:hypothetical protein n=1 Tax=Streptomyces chryseus TaxID=68186 RepID=UPI00147782AB|nr:hypothetical protein [Streptomyces chryseus]